MTNFIYVIFGEGEGFLLEAAYSIGTLRRHLDPQKSRIIVFTDRPEKIRSWPVTCVSIADQIEAMKGPLGYIFRVKLCCLQQSLETNPGNTVYVDSDTFFKKSPEALTTRLQAGCALIHRRDHLAISDSPFKNLQLRLPDGTEYHNEPGTRMYNAGIIGLRPEAVGIVKTALILCDAQLQRAGKCHICEQLAISEALRLSGLKITETGDVVAHYYRSSAKKYMRHQISRRGLREGREPWNLEQDVPYSYFRIQSFKFRKWLRR